MRFLHGTGRMTEGVSGGNLTNLIYEDMLPNQIKNAHFLPVGEPMPDGSKVLENSVFCVFFVDIHEPSCELMDLFFECHFIYFVGLAFCAFPL
jgi:hypothetical protein